MGQLYKAQLRDLTAEELAEIRKQYKWISDEAEQFVLYLKRFKTSFEARMAAKHLIDMKVKNAKRKVRRDFGEDQRFLIRCIEYAEIKQ